MKKILLALLVSIFVLSACTSKPSRGQVEDAFREQILANTEIDTDKARKAVDTYVECYIGEIYDDVDAQTLRDFVEADLTERRDPFASDQEGISDAALEKCSDKLVEEN